MRKSFVPASMITRPMVQHPHGSSGGEVIGINFGFDAVTEHGSGIAEIQRAFGIPQGPARRSGTRALIAPHLVGAIARTVTEVPEGLKFFDLRTAVYLVYSPIFAPSGPFGRSGREPTAEGLDYMMEIDGPVVSLCAAWSDQDFGIRVIKSDDTRGGVFALREIYEALMAKDAMIYLGRNKTPFDCPSLMLLIRSRVPEHQLLAMREVDEQYLTATAGAERASVGPAE